ncbi:hypothetical protein [Streptomyces subrutilus]|uniref:Uncharacterized protein n=1 Tax=Streptomyces subrutilus TaxID=36818 RepID=A0A5P2UHX9_9ACTN|nr:hypothetical protein [Streptomyces subrutilus]QEU78866.1 hypothetical protein CP968_11695 [Streptomyces subrutilus]WSJ31951.1 hypothetical protein OG479_23200 [Streptomyces subrutilus]GGZ83686.1 hypothetical protein GCM10010371_49260 [Streptomyces subrutilus]
MNTLLNLLTVLALAAPLLAPALYGALRERRIDRQLAAAARGEPAAPGRGPAPAADRSPQRGGARSAARHRGHTAHRAPTSARAGERAA